MYQIDHNDQWGHLESIPCLTPSKVLPFYVTAETGSVECPGFAALSTLFAIIQNVQSSPISQTSNWSAGFFLEAQYNNLALIP